MFNLKAENNQVISPAKFKNKSSPFSRVSRRCKKTVLPSATSNTRLSTAGEPYFVLKAQNGEVIGKSQMDSSEAADQTGMASVQKTHSPPRLPRSINPTPL